MHPIPDTPLAVLTWLARYAYRIEFQELNPRSRQKNRVMLQYRLPGCTEVKAIGGITLAGAVMKAAIRNQAGISEVPKAS